jgi:RND family efflux transporter MFP subunit
MLAAATASWASVAGCGTNEYVAPPPPEVDVARPVLQTITRSLEFTGTTEPSETVEIQARVKGFLKEIKFNEGADDVRAGDVLYVIDPQPFEVKVNQANASVKMAQAERLSADAQLKSAQAERQNAESQLARNRAAGGAVTAAEIEALEAQLSTAIAAVDAAVAAQASAESQLSAANAALAEAELDLSYTRVRSPIDGRVGRTLVDVGNLVGANETTHLTTVIRYDPIHAYYTISESVLLQWIEWRDEGRVESSPSGDPESSREVRLGLANEQGFPHHGRFDYADLAVDESSGTFLVRAVFDNPNKAIPPGAFVRVQVPLFPEEVLLVDDVAVSRDQAGPYVLTVAADQTVERRSVQLGERYKGARVIQAGLSTDDRVVVNGVQRARPGGKVQVTEVPMNVPADEPAPSNGSSPSEGASPPVATPVASESSPSVPG